VRRANTRSRQSSITGWDFDEFVECYRGGEIHKREATWSEEHPEGRWRSYSYDEIPKRDKLNLFATTAC
jgi:type I restriction enzyme M protein